MRVIKFTDLAQIPWRNGGGITREIAVKRDGAALVWRLSMADVDGDGAFSKFDGLKRILTVIDGNGMELAAPHKTLHADLAVPVSFDGGWEINAKLKSGPLRDLNLIFDPTLCQGEVVVLASGPQTLLASPEKTCALHCLKGNIKLSESDALQKGDTALFEHGLQAFEIYDDAQALLITLET